MGSEMCIRDRTMVVNRLLSAICAVNRLFEYCILFTAASWADLQLPRLHLSARYEYAINMALKSPTVNF